MGREWVVGEGSALAASAPPSLRKGIAFLVVQGHLPGICYCYTEVPGMQAGEQKSSRTWPEALGDPEAEPLS